MIFSASNFASGVPKASVMEILFVFGLSNGEGGFKLHA